MKRKRKKQNDVKDISFFKEYNFEIIVLTMFLLGVFLLVENMEISETLFAAIKALIFFFADFIKSIRDFIYDILHWLEVSDLVGVCLILFALYLISIRIRIRLLASYPKIYGCQNCDSKSKLKRIKKKNKTSYNSFCFTLACLLLSV